ncbi:MAG: hypothetical protein ACMG6E_06025 [Candidatus Roizmanbacteria bacterium]
MFTKKSFLNDIVPAAMQTKINIPSHQQYQVSKMSQEERSPEHSSKLTTQKRVAAKFRSMDFS